jgi:hypothetical protein
MKTGDTEKLAEGGSGENDSNIRYYCKTEELFDIFETAHVNTGHKRTRGNTLFSLWFAKNILCLSFEILVPFFQSWKLN